MAGTGPALLLSQWADTQDADRDTRLDEVE